LFLHQPFCDSQPLDAAPDVNGALLHEKFLSLYMFVGDWIEEYKSLIGNSGKPGSIAPAITAGLAFEVYFWARPALAKSGNDFDIGKPQLQSSDANIPPSKRKTNAPSCLILLGRNLFFIGRHPRVWP
jgi:hypothetical protein